MEENKTYTEHQLKLMNLAKHFAGKNIDIGNIDEELDKTDGLDVDNEYEVRQKSIEKQFYERCRESGVLKEYRAAAVRDAAKEQAVATMYIRESMAKENIENITRNDLEEYTNTYCDHSTSAWLVEQDRKYPVHVICMLNVIAFYKHYYEKYLLADNDFRRTISKEGIDANYKNIKERLRKSEHFAKQDKEKRFIDLELPQVVVDYANEFIEHYNETFGGKCGKRERKQCIQVIDCETNMIVHTFMLRSDVLNIFDISKGRLSQVLQSAKENPLAKHTWKKVKHNGKKYWLCEKYII